MPSLPKALREPAETVLVLCTLLLVWQLAVMLFKLPDWLLPPPTAIGEAFIKNAGLMLKHTVSTGIGAVVGIVAGTIGAVVLAIFMAQFPIIERAALPLLLIDQSIPKAAIAPLLIIWFGSGMLPRIIIVVIITFFPLVVSTVRGLTATDPRISDLMHVLSGGRLKLLTKVQLPSAIPYIFSGLKVAAPLAVIGSVIAEFLQSNAGLGYIVLVSLSQSDTAMIFVAILGMAFLSVMLFGIIRAIETAVLRRRYAHLAAETRFE